MKRSGLLWSLLLMVLSVTAQEKPQLSADEFEKYTTASGNLLDVRTATEYRTVHIAHSMQADWNNKQEFTDRVQYLDKTKPLYVYCAAGIRSAAAAKWLRSNGFTQVYELTGGIVNWQQAGKPVEKEASVQQYTTDTYNALLTGKDPVLIDFGAPWCPPCKKMEPVLQQLQQEHPHNVKVITVDAGIHTDIMKQLQVTTLPTFILYKQGKEVWRSQGIISKETLTKAIQ